jgi:alpha-beta hydrolase superfamily lysophospholipase
LTFEALKQDFLIEGAPFTSQSTEIAGSLVLPTSTKIVAGVVLVHGSGKQKQSLYWYWAKRFAENGIAALVYDKRCVGKSGGYNSKLFKPTANAF